MTLDDVLGLKQRFLQHDLPALAAHARELGTASILSRGINESGAAEIPPLCGFGIGAGKVRNSFVPAIRLTDPVLVDSPTIRAFLRETRGEIDLRITGPIVALSALPAKPWNCERCRPLEAGLSVGHYDVTAGTIGTFVRKRNESEILMLSNNHVFANLNRARKGDEILQPGRHDSGRTPEDVVGHLEQFRRIRFNAENTVDAAVATVASGIEVIAGTIRDIGKLAGIAKPQDLLTSPAAAVRKAGRTTGLRNGKVVAVAISTVHVSFSTRKSAIFTDQIEIHSTTQQPFGRGGDSGALVVTEDRLAAGLLFAGEMSGGTGGLGVIYANPIGSVLEAFDVELISG